MRGVVLVTGGCGFIGSHFVRHLLATYPDYDVVNLDRLTYAGNPTNLADVAAQVAANRQGVSDLLALAARYTEPVVAAYLEYVQDAAEQKVRQALEPVLSEIISAVRRVIEDATPEVTADIFYSGLILTGGGALLHGLPERLQNDLRLKVKVPEDPLTTVALGAGRLLDEPEQLQRASLRLDAPVWEQAEKLAVNW